MSDYPTAIDAALASLQVPAPQPRKKRLSIDEILDQVSDLAQDPEAGADRFRALKMLASTQNASVVLPQPLSESDILMRLMRVMKGAGKRMTQVAYLRAFPRSVGSIRPKDAMNYERATPEMHQRAARCTSLKMLNTMYPEAKVHGIPKGFPSGRSVAIKRAWCQDQALKIEVERDARTRVDAYAELTAKDGDAGSTENTDAV